MRLIHVITALHTGGAERVLAQLSHQWAGRHELHVAYLKPVRTLAGLFHPQTQMHEIGLGRHTLGRLRSLYRSVKPDVVHTHLVHADFLGLAAARGLPVQPWLTLHNAHFRTDARDFLFQTAYRTLFAYLGPRLQAVAISEAVKRHAEEAWALPPSRVYKLLNPLSVPQPRLPRAEARKRLGLQAEEPVFVFLGRLEPQKGLIYLLRALALLQEQGLRPTVFLVGEGSQSASLQAAAQNLGLEVGQRLHFTGLSSEPGLYLSAADALLLPSLFEGLGNVVAEAAAFGLPVIASDLEGPAEILQNGQTGLLVPPGAPEPLAAAMRLLIEDAAYTRTMGAAALHMAGAWPDYALYAEDLIGLYRNT